MPAVSFPVVLCGALFSLGCAYAGWTAGLGLFAALYEILRAHELEATFDSKEALGNLRYIFWFFGFAAGALTFLTWHRREPAPANIGAAKCTAVFALGGAGATHLGYLLINGASVEAMVTVSFLSLVGGCMLLALCYGGMRPLPRFAGRFLIAAAASVAALWFSLAFDKAVSQRYDSIGKERILWVRVEFPGQSARPGYEKIEVSLRTATDNVKCFAIQWETGRDGRTYLPVRCDFTEMTSDRTLILTLPDRAPVEIRMPFARNPSPMYDYSGWQGSGPVNFRYRVS